jgi:hypothetical protein
MSDSAGGGPTGPGASPAPETGGGGIAVRVRRMLAGGAEKTRQASERHASVAIPLPP